MHQIFPESDRSEVNGGTCVEGEEQETTYSSPEHGPQSPSEAAEG